MVDVSVKVLAYALESALLTLAVLASSGCVRRALGRSPKCNTTLSFRMGVSAYIAVLIANVLITEILGPERLVLHALVLFLLAVALVIGTAAWLCRFFAGRREAS